MKRNRNFWLNFILEIIAVFIGILAAFYVDDYRKKEEISLAQERHYQFLGNEVFQDSINLAVLREDLLSNFQAIDSLFDNWSSSVQIKLTYEEKSIIEQEFIHPNPIDLFEVFLNSKSFNEIFDLQKFGIITKIISEYRIFFDLQDRINDAMNALNNEYLFLVEDQFIIKKKTDFISRVNHINQLNKLRYFAVLNILDYYSNLLRELH